MPLQVGFNRRFASDFAAAHDAVVRGTIGTPHQLRSVTRDPGLADPAAVPPWTIFLLTLIHDFDLLLWMNPETRPVEVHAVADALVAPDFKDAGLLDTAIVVIRFANGTMATAEASFSAAFGYDVRAEIFGSAGMVMAGDQRRTALRTYTADGMSVETSRSDVELFLDAYTAEFAEFVAAVREGRDPAVTGHDARRALAVALACIESVQTNAPAKVVEVTMTTPFVLAASAEMLFLDLPFVDRVRRLHERGFLVEIWDWTTKDVDALVATGASFSSMTGYVEGSLTDPARGIPRLLETAEQSIEVAHRLGCPRLNLHGTGLDALGQPVDPVEEVTGRMWLPHATPWASSPRWPSRPASSSRWRTSTPRWTIPACRSRGPRTPCPRGGGRQPWPAAQPGPLPRADRRGEPDRPARSLPAVDRRDPGRRRPGPV